MTTGRVKDKAKTTIYPDQELIDIINELSDMEGTSNNKLIESMLWDQVRRHENYEKALQIIEVKNK